MKNLIYRFTNKSNGKVYIGLTTQTIHRRLSEHKYRFTSSDRDHKLYQALRKYGWDNFDIEVIFIVFDKTHLPEFEKLFIDEYDSFNNGYNMTSGDALISEETRDKLRQAMIGRNITWIDKIMKTKRERGVYKSGSENHNAKEYLIKDSDGFYIIVNGLSEYAKSVGVDTSNLLKTLGKKKHCRGNSVALRLNDHPEREYTLAGGNAEYLGTLPR